jgi:hypothetical protein
LEIANEGCNLGRSAVAAAALKGEQVLTTAAGAAPLEGEKVLTSLKVPGTSVLVSL